MGLLDELRAKQQGKEPNANPQGLVDEVRLLELVGRKKYCTPTYLYRVLGWSRPRITRITHKLKQRGLLDALDDIRPKVYRLSRKGALLHGFKHRAWPSMSIIKQQCALNQIEWHLREKLNQVRVLSREQLQLEGFFPAHAEYVLEFWQSTSAQEKQRMLIVIDDYGMPSERLKRIWGRRHLEKQGGVKTYKNFVSHWLVFCSDEALLERHKTYANNHQLPIQCHFIKPIWTSS